ncbi:hypothetical protein EJB05_47742, partial [Eragrostis curvula]
MAKSSTVRGGSDNDDHHVGGESDGSSLPEDQVFEMLTRVSLDDLAACRMVSARWRRLTYEPGFAPLHCRRAAAVSGFFVQSMTRNRYAADFVSMHSPSSSPTAKISLAFLPSAHVRIVAVAAHRGLVCCVEADTRRPPCYYVCKPATRQWRALPNPRVRFRAAATAMVARPPPSGAAAAAAAEFKIVRLSVVPELRDRLRCEVFDSRRFAWRRSADVALPPDSLVPAAPAVRAHGAMHWLRWPDRITGAQDVFAFDMRSEAWRLIRLPPEVEEEEVEGRWARKMITAVEGRLCLVVTMEVADEEVVEVWEMASYVDARWEKKMTVGLNSLHMKEGRAVVLRDLCSSDVAFFDSFCRVMWYDFWRGKMAEVEVNHICVQEVFKFESDLVPCEIGRVACRPPARSPSEEPTACLDDVDKFS